MPWTVYLARCGDGSLYTGITNDLAARMRTHNAGRGAAYTRGRLPVVVVYQEPASDRSAALRREWAIKQLSRRGKEGLMSSEFTGFRRGATQFLRRLKRRNTREWFEANRRVYEIEVREPFRALVEEMDVRFARFAPEILGEPKRSMFRIHRDVRFSKDKSPYKTHAACWFYHHDAGRGVGQEAAHGGAGFYFHLAPEESFVGGGIWMPPRPALGLIREALADRPEQFERIVLAPAFKRRFGPLDQEGMLKRLPRGFADGHPAARWLRYQSFTAGRRLNPVQIFDPSLPRILERDYRALLPLVRWLNSAIGFAAAERR